MGPLCKICCPCTRRGVIMASNPGPRPSTSSPTTTSSNQGSSQRRKGPAGKIPSASSTTTKVIEATYTATFNRRLFRHCGLHAQTSSIVSKRLKTLIRGDNPIHICPTYLRNKSSSLLQMPTIASTKARTSCATKRLLRPFSTI